MSQRMGYTHVSTDYQLLDLQRDALQQAGCRVIYEAAASGKNTARPELEQCCKALRVGSTLVVWRFDPGAGAAVLVAARARGRAGGASRSWMLTGKTRLV